MKITEDPEVLNILGLDDLEPVGVDRYDFPEVSVLGLRDALEIAYQKGYAQGIEDHLRNGQ